LAPERGAWRSRVLISHILKEKGEGVLQIPPYATLREAARILATNRIGALLILTSHRSFDGIISERDIVRAFAEHGAGALDIPVADCMVKDIAFCEKSDTIEEITDIMTRCRFRHLPVMEEGLVIGIVSIGDVVKTRIAETARESQALKQYIAAS